MDDNNWDLFAVVRGCSAGSAGAATAASDPFSSFLVEDSDGEKDRSFVFFPDPMDTSSCPCEPQELCNPSSHEMGTPPQLPPVLSPTTPLPPAAAYPRHSPQRAPSQTPRSKRKKSQQKKVVCQVPADGAHSDLWAWRKYGQKPIKGSPYPRGYYRCSSSKGCQARKQVERSRADPRTLLITYTAEHNHPIPAHRNSHAGSTRQKLPPPAASPHLGRGELFISRRSRKTEKGEEGEEEEELVVGSVESLEEDDDDDDDSQLLLALDTVRLSSAYMEVESSLEEHFLSSPWLTNLNAAAAAGGR